MKLSIKHVAAAVALAIGAPAAMAFDTPTATQNSSIVVTVFDTVAGNSLVQVLQPNQSFGDGTLNYGEFSEATATPDAGLNLTFNINLSALTSAGSSLSNIRWTVYAGDGNGVVNSSGGQQGVMFTAQSGLTPASLGMTTAAISAMNGTTAYGQIAATFGAAALQGTGTNFGTGYFGGSSWGESIGTAGLFNGSGALDASLGFYYSTKVSATSSVAAPTVAYQNANGLASWSLSSAGLLTYNVPAPSGVPLPAGVWLLLSGLGGLGVFGRRRAVAA
jgi:hypothetical protein